LSSYLRESWRTRQNNSYFGKLAGPRIDLYRSRMLLHDDVVTDRQAKASSLSGWFGREEGIKRSDCCSLVLLNRRSLIRSRMSGLCCGSRLLSRFYSATTPSCRRAMPRTSTLGSKRWGLLVPAANGVLQPCPVSRRVNSSRAPDDDPTLIEPEHVAHRPPPPLQ